MRLKLTLEMTSRHNMLPVNYQYYISAWVYKVLASADAKFATFLHNEGYGQSTSHSFKLFSFDKLKFSHFTLWKEQQVFEIQGPLYLYIGFHLEDTAQHFMKGLFLNQADYLGDKFHQIDFEVTKVDQLSQPDFQETSHYRLQTPWVVAYKSDRDKYAQFLSPKDPSFVPLAIKHIVGKYNETLSSPQDRIELNEVQLEVIPSTHDKKQGYLIKPHSPDETRVIGYLCDCVVKAPRPIHELIWNAGICEKSSMGFGWVQYLNK